jgi:hypothetical protein
LTISCLYFALARSFLRLCGRFFWASRFARLTRTVAPEVRLGARARSRRAIRYITRTVARTKGAHRLCGWFRYYPSRNARAKPVRVSPLRGSSIRYACIKYLRLATRASEARDTCYQRRGEAACERAMSLSSAKSESPRGATYL